MPRPSIADRYDQAIADSFLASAGQGAGGLPGYLGIELVRFEPGRLWCRATIRDELLTPFGNAHGGVVAGIVDHITGVVVYPLLKPGQWAATTEIKLNYIAPVKAGLLETESSVVALTNRSAVVRGEVYGADHNLVCAAQGTLTIVDPRPG
ncbi:PaaI family thioesterase [Acidiferrimicrobium sp. IK]|uniref:PaaI family thioesterase n=1 Tax=Acidiferrimicrobium sp. IK TaxID=2871700 RepID=UPI0021CB4A4B|nr:PaaI family thioesterase [Acidiferrimicrobium sp. IK]MCU4187474.1 PaaI family thioesterase [Acidiferrimicrobium sp. IK]